MPTDRQSQLLEDSNHCQAVKLDTPGCIGSMSTTNHSEAILCFYLILWASPACLSRGNRAISLIADTKSDSCRISTRQSDFLNSASFFCASITLLCISCLMKLSHLLPQVSLTPKNLRSPELTALLGLCILVGNSGLELRHPIMAVPSCTTT